MYGAASATIVCAATHTATSALSEAMVAAIVHDRVLGIFATGIAGIGDVDQSPGAGRTAMVVGASDFGRDSSTLFGAGE